MVKIIRGGNMKTLIQFVLGAFLVVAIFIAAGMFLPLGNINWGTIKTMPANTIVVSGEAKSTEKNQVASFTAGVDSVNDDKDAAVNEVNEKIAALTQAVKDFGIDAADIQTQNISVYRSEEMYYADGGSQKSRPGQWRVNNSINITLRDISRANGLTNLLTDSGATNVYGPNFAMEDTQDAKNKLLSQAVEDARAKAELMIAGTGRKLGKVISISEGGVTNPIMPMYDARGMGGGAALEPGSSEVYASVTVVFELR